MTDANSLSLYEHASIMARQLGETMFTEPDDDWEPMIFLKPGDESEGWPILPVGPFMQSNATKNILAEAVIPSAVERFQATEVVMILSTWTSENSSKMLHETGEYKPPSEQDDRKELLMLSEIKSTGAGRHAFAPIERHEDGPPTLGEWEELEQEADITGRFVEPVVRALKKVSASS